MPSVCSLVGISPVRSSQRRASTPRSSRGQTEVLKGGRGPQPERSSGTLLARIAAVLPLQISVLDAPSRPDQFTGPRSQLLAMNFRGWFSDVPGRLTNVRGWSADVHGRSADFPRTSRSVLGRSTDARSRPDHSSIHFEVTPRSFFHISSFHASSANK